MSTTCYHTQAHALHSGLAAQNSMPTTPNIVTNGFSSQIPQKSSRDVASMSPGLADTPEKPHHTYSGVAASRPSSPVFTSKGGMLRHPPPKAQVQSTTAKEHIPATAGIAFRNAILVPDCKSDLSELSELSDCDENPNPWIKVVPGCACSLDSLSKARMNKNFIAKVLRTEKEIVFNQAEEQPRKNIFLVVMRKFKTNHVSELNHLPRMVKGRPTPRVKVLTLKIGEWLN
jgi:hypothetical protein